MHIQHLRFSSGCHCFVYYIPFKKATDQNLKNLIYYYMSTRTYSNNFSTIRGSHSLDSNVNFSSGQEGGMHSYLSFNPVGQPRHSSGNSMIHGSLMGRGAEGQKDGAPIAKNALHSIHNKFKKDLSAGSTGNTALQSANIPHTANARSLKGSGSARRIGTKNGYMFKR